MQKLTKKLIFVEGNDDQEFLTKLCKKLTTESVLATIIEPIIDQIATENGKGGDGGFKSYKYINTTLTSIVKKFTDESQDFTIDLFLVRDADDNFQSCQDSTQELINKINNDFPEITNISYYIFPDNENKGMLETFLMEIIEEDKSDAVVNCVKNFADCIESIQPKTTNLPKLKMISYLYASMKQQNIARAFKSSKSDILKNKIFSSQSMALKKLEAALIKFLNA